MKKSKYFLYTYIFLGIILLPVFFIGASVILWAFLRNRFDKIEIDKNQIYSRLGIININIQTIPLNKINNISVKANKITKLLGFSTIEIQSSEVKSITIHTFSNIIAKILNLKTITVHTAKTFCKVKYPFINNADEIVNMIKSYK